MREKTKPIRVPEEVHSELRIAAAKEGVSIGEVTLRLVTTGKKHDKKFKKGNP